MERGGITIFDFLECWGHESPLRTFGMVGVLPTPLDFWEDGVLSAPLNCWDGGVLSTLLAFWDGGVVKGFRKGGDIQVSPKAQGERRFWGFWHNATGGGSLEEPLAQCHKGRRNDEIFGLGPQGGKGTNFADTMGP